MSTRFFSAILIALFVSVQGLPAAELITDATLGFRFRVPDGFAHDPSKIHGDTIQAFAKAAPSNQIGTFIIITRLNGIINRQKIDSKEVAAANSQATILSEQWKGHEIEVFRVPQVVNGRRTVRFTAQVPLAGEAIQISIIGDQAREAELRVLLQTVLADLDGKSNWLSDVERSDRILYLLVTVGIMVLFWILRKSRSDAAGDSASTRITPDQFEFGTACPRCGHAPYFEPSGCSVCGTLKPKSLRASQCAGRGMLIGLAAGAVVGGIYGYDNLASGWAGSLGGALVGSIPGMFAGLLLGLLIALLIRTGGKASAS